MGTQDFAIRGFIISSEHQVRSDLLFCRTEVVTRNVCREKEKELETKHHFSHLWAKVFRRIHNQKMLQIISQGLVMRSYSVLREK